VDDQRRRTTDPGGRAVTVAAHARPDADALVTLARDLEPAASSGDIVDVLATGAGAKPLAGVTLCYTDDGRPAWDVVDSSATALERGALGDCLDDLGFVWRLDPVGTATEDRKYVWYDLLLALPGGEGAAYLETAPSDPATRDAGAYGRALGYPDTAIDWFDGDPVPIDRSVFDVVRAARPDDTTALALAACVPYVPAPTSSGAADAVADGRRLVDALCRLGTEARATDYVRGLLCDRVRGTLPRVDAPDTGGDLLATAMPC